MDRPTQPERKWLSLLLGLITLGVIGPSTAEADPADLTGLARNAIPYQGWLDYEGAPVNASLVFNFALFNCPSSDNCDDPESELLWVASLADPLDMHWPDVEAPGVPISVFAGQFVTELGGGAQIPLPEDLFVEDWVYLAIAIHTSDGEVVVLDGRQRISPTPWSIRADEAVNLRVRGQLDVDGRAHLYDSFEVDGRGHLHDALEVDGYTHLHDEFEVDGEVQFHDIIRSNVDIVGDVTITGSENNGTNSALHITSSSQTMRIDGNEIDSSGVLQLNRNSGYPVRVPVYNNIEESNDDAGPEAYLLVTSGGDDPLMPHPCNASNRGALAVVGLADIGQDGLCACLLVGGDYEWWCFNP